MKADTVRGKGRKLVLVPMLKAHVSGGTIGLTKKFVDGVEQQARHWPGNFQVLMHPTSLESNNLDCVTYVGDQVPFDLAVHPLQSREAAEVLGTATLAQLSLDPEQNHLPALCKRLGVSCAITTEYTLRTRVQIARAEVRNPFRLARRAMWEVGQEKQYRKAVAVADGVQCNGTPTFDAYSKLNESPLLFFDTRSTEKALATERDLEVRFGTRRSSDMLRLAFSGRLIAMKGADHLVRVANILRDAKKPFSLSICGSGDLEDSMRAYVSHHELGSVVSFLGNLDFQTELLPLLRREVDLFVSCHRQGDPSCTYLETMACGVPIVGYDNEAWQGLSRVSGCGWVSPMNRPADLAAKIMSLTDREIETQSRATLQFARAHTFESEFEKRMEHLRSLARLPT